METAASEERFKELGLFREAKTDERHDNFLQICKRFIKEEFSQYQ